MEEISQHPQEQKGAGGETSAEQPAGVQETAAAKEVNKDARMWAMFCHLAGLGGLLIPIVGNIVAPLVIWQIKKDDFPFVGQQGKEAVNFQISMSIYGFVAALLCFVCIGIPLLVAVYVVDVVFLLIAAVKANNGYHYRYPLTIRFIR